MYILFRAFVTLFLSRELAMTAYFFVFASLLLLLSIFFCYCRAEVIRFLNQAEKTGEGLLRLAALEWPPTLPSDLLTETTIAGTLRRQLEDRKGKVVTLFMLSLNSCPLHLLFWLHVSTKKYFSKNGAGLLDNPF